MEWTQQDEDYLRDFIDRNTEDDNTQLKKQIKEKLVNNKYIAKVLDNKELEDDDAEPEDYFGINILPYLIVAPTQTRVSNYICFETRSVLSSSYNRNRNNAMKIQQIIFQVMCQEQNKDVTGTFGGAICSYGTARHDLLAALLKREFNFYPFNGGKAILVSEDSGTTDTNYAMRVLTYEFQTDAELAKSMQIGGKTQLQMVNKIYAE